MPSREKWTEFVKGMISATDRTFALLSASVQARVASAIDRLAREYKYERQEVNMDVERRLLQKKRRSGAKDRRAERLSELLREGADRVLQRKKSSWTPDGHVE